MPPSPKDVLGPILIGLLFDAILLGALTIQVFTYFYRYRRDRLWFKLLIGYLFIIEIVNTTLDFATAYVPLIQKFGSPQASPIFLLADPITTTLVSTPVQLFMAWRIKVISRTILTPIIIGVFSLASFGGSVWLSYQINTGSIRSRYTQAASSTWLITSSITDATISLAIVYFLASQRRTMTTRDEQLSMSLSRIMGFAVESGVLTSLSMIVALIVFFTVHRGPYFLILDLSFSKLYTNSLIASLNARAVRNQEEQAQPALFIDDSTNTNNSKVITITGVSQPSMQTWEDVSVGLSMTAVQTKTPFTRFPERTTSLGQISSTLTPVTAIRVIYPDDSGRYRVPGAAVPLKQFYNTSDFQPPNQYHGHQNA